ncbi:MAG: gliding motility-associated ABC transporter permease subunit GldF [Sphingobacteriales bacterium]|nr:gliding motility-associated ABC transporter permease subunit GldF [Sphingobacteriales bacterium]
MWSICKKELRQFFSSLTGYIAIIIFLLLNGLFLFVFNKSNILDDGYASMDRFFELAPWILLLLVPAVTMRLVADEVKSGTIELLQTRPLSNWQIITGKFFAALTVVVIAVLPTIIYVLSLNGLAATGTSLDAGGIMGSYIGLFFLCAAFTAVGLCCSSFTNNAVVAFLLSGFVCFVLYFGFSSLSQLSQLKSGADYYIEKIGIDFHYRSVSRGVIDSRDVVYFISAVFLFLIITQKRLAKKY